MFATARACTARPFAHTDGACRRPVPLPYMISTSLGNSHSETLQLRKAFCPFREFCFPKTCSNPVVAAVYKNKLTVSRRRYLARVLSSLMYRYVCARAKAMSAFLIYCHGYGDFRPITSLTCYLLCNSVQRHIIQRSPTIDITFVSHPNGQRAIGYFDLGNRGILPVSVSGQHKRSGQFPAVCNGV